VVAGGIEAKGSPAVGRDIGEVAGIEPLGVAITDDPLPVFASIQGVLDFTTPLRPWPSPRSRRRPASSMSSARQVCPSPTRPRSLPPPVMPPSSKPGNMSLGVNLLAGLTGARGGVLGPEFDIEILEMHHRHKRDAPSGTSLMLGAAAASARGISLDERGVRSRDGETGPRREGDIGFAALRGGDVVGEHKVIFAGPGERIELAHIATDRGIFARGAVRAALWAKGKAPGLYSMKDVLGL
jgi:4-hydroxy-tetrahydrodipicolinate reductase